MITNASGDAGKLEAAAKIVATKAPGVPVIINTENPQAAEAAIKLFADKRPMLYGANASNAEAMANIAKSSKAILGVVANGLAELSDLTEKVKGLGVEDMVIDSGARKAKDIISDNTLIRRAAVKRTSNLSDIL